MKLFDTCTLINNVDDFCNSVHRNFAISSITYNELNSIKESKHKDEDVKYAAKRLIKWFKENPDKYKMFLFKNSWTEILNEHDIEIINDTKIVATGYYNDLTLVTDDAGCWNFAKALEMRVDNYKKDKEKEYRGYYILEYSEDNMDTFYDYALPEQKNPYDLLINEYLLIKDKDGNVVDKYKWTENGYEHLYDYKYYTCESVAFGKLKPRDAYQLCAIDSFNNNKITMLTGKAGSGKSLLSISYLFSKMEHGEIDKIIMFVNPVATRGAAKLGYLPGDKNAKILDSQIGNFLISKVGDRYAVEKLIEDGKLFLVPMSDCRGFDTTGMNAGIYVTEAQNMSVDMMKLLLQRIGEDCICILEGDDKSQVDMSEYAGSNNGMKRVSEVFKGQNYFGKVQLNNCYRSKIAERAELM